MKIRYVWIIISFLFVVVVINHERSSGSLVRVTGSILAAFENSGRTVRRTLRIFRDIRSLPAENDSLNSRLSDLLFENARLKEIEHENQLLKNELKISSDLAERRVVAARIVARSPFSFFEVVTVDRGQRDGLADGQAATLHGNLVGRVVATSENSAQLQLITSSDAIIQARLQNSRANGIVRGGVQGLQLELIAQDVTILPGENVITSGLGGALRPGILIGTVLAVSSNKSDIFQSVAVKPATDMNTVDIVFIEVK